VNTKTTPSTKATNTEPVKVAYFGFDSGNENIRRRIQAITSTGTAVTGFMQRRGELGELSWNNIDLGLTRDRAFVHRFVTILKNCLTLLKHRRL